MAIQRRSQRRRATSATGGRYRCTARRPTGWHFADRVAAVALKEWSFFGNQTYDIGGFPTQVGHQEAENGWYQRIGTYWKDGAELDGIDGRNHTWYWSAAFMSWVMCSAGAGARFHYSSEDSVYISQAIIDQLNGNLAAGFWGVRLTEAQPSVGDIVCWARQPGIAYDNLNGGNYAAHTDLVVSVAPNQIDIVGGDVGDSVTRRTLPLENGFLTLCREAGIDKYSIAVNLEENRPEIRVKVYAADGGRQADRPEIDVGSDGR